MSTAKIGLYAGEKNPMFGKAKPLGSGTPSKQIEVIDIKNNIITRYDSISSAALALNIQRSIISMIFRRKESLQIEISFQTVRANFNLSSFYIHCQNLQFTRSASKVNK